MNPTKLKPFFESHRIKQRAQDEQMWYMGMYVQNATMVSVERCLAGKKAHLKYFDKPILQSMHLSDEKEESSEKNEMLAVEEFKRYAAALRSEGYKETEVLY